MLLVEDDDDTRDILAELLSEDFDVVAASNGLEALDLARESSLDLIVTDETLPGLTGTGLARTLKAEGHRTPILLVSGFRHGLDTSVVEGVLSKPVSLEGLVSEARRLLAGVEATAHAP
jgi:DNA-binding response OmpR family regulator